MSQYNLIIFPRAEERIDSVIDFLLTLIPQHFDLTLFISS